MSINNNSFINKQTESGTENESGTESEKKQHTYSVFRESFFSNIACEQVISNNFELDSDIVCNQTGEIIYQNRHRFITNKNFANDEEINKYLRFWGKIPEFLEIRTTPHKGYGVFTLQDIDPDTDIGVYQGIYRINECLTDSLYVYKVNNFSNIEENVIDAENITFSNFTRFINHNDHPNCISNIVCFMIIISTKQFIPKGSEITINYGKDYWKNSGIVKV